jgi:large subunit ribosomal protein L18
MLKKQSSKDARAKRHYKLRNKISGTTQKPRLSVYRSNEHIYAQIIDDTVGHTLCAASTAEKAINSTLEYTSTVEAATAVGISLAAKAVALGISDVVFDRGGYLYHGKVAALADAAREGGLKF